MYEARPSDVPEPLLPVPTWHAGSADTSVPLESVGERPIQHLVVLCGLIGSGKSTLAQAAVDTWPGTWDRLNQDELGRRTVVEARVRASFEAGHHILLDRTNIDRRQRADWLLIAAEVRRSTGRRIVTSLLFLDVPVSVCRERLRLRTDHPTLKTTEDALRVLAMFERSIVRPTPTVPEGFDRMLVLFDIPATLLPAYLLDVWHRLEQAPRLPRAGEVLYAAEPRQRPGQGRGPRGRGRAMRPRGASASSWRRTPPTTRPLMRASPPRPTLPPP